MPSVTINQAANAVIATAKRFPLAGLTSVALTLVSIVTANGHDWTVWLEALLTMLFCSVAFRLLAEARLWPERWAASLAALPLVILVAPLVGTEDGLMIPLLSLMISGAGLGVAVPSLSKLAQKEELASVWGRALCFSVALAAAASLILSFGLTFLVAGLSKLFDLYGLMRDGRYVGTVWSIGAFLVGPWVLMSLIPRLDRTAESFVYPRWVAVLVDWLLSPLVIAHLALLNGYCLFILVNWSMPKGVIGLFVTGVTIAGGVGWCAAYAAGAEAGWASRWLRRLYFPALMPPAIALVLAIVIRIQDHGVTEDRYLLLLKAAVLLVLGAWQLLRRKVPNPSQAAILPALLMLLASFGPLSASSISIQNQTAHLKTLLEASGHLVAGKIVKDGPPVALTDGLNISSAVEYVLKRGQGKVILGWFDQPPTVSAKASSSETVSAVVRAMGVPYVRGEWEITHNISSDVYFKPHFLLDVRGFDFIQTVNMNINKMQTDIAPTTESDGFSLHFDGQKGRISVSDHSGMLGEFDLSSFLEFTPETNIEAPVYDLPETGRWKLRFIPHGISRVCKKNHGQCYFDELDGQLLIARRR